MQLRKVLLVLSGCAACTSASEVSDIHGVYGGSTKVRPLGTLYAWVDFKDATHADINVQFSSMTRTGCHAEAYSLDSATGQISLPGQTDPNDCLYKYTQGKLAFLSIDSVSYDSTTDTIDTALSLKSKLDPQTVTVALKRGFKPPAAPPSPLPTPPTPIPPTPAPPTPLPPGSCPNGYFKHVGNACTQCPKGYFAIGASATRPGASATSCTACAMGTYSDKPASATCNGCPDGQFTNKTAQSVCTPRQCPPGSFYKPDRCGLEFYDKIGKCPQCTGPVSFVDLDQPLSTALFRKSWQSGMQCSVDSFGGDPSHGNKKACVCDCQSCPAGYFKGETSTKCTKCSSPCPEGQTQRSLSSCECSKPDCSAGKYYSSASSTCIGCPMGKFSKADSVSCDACPLCPAGKLQRDYTSCSCTFVPAGSFFDNRMCGSEYTKTNDAAPDLACGKCGGNVTFGTAYPTLSVGKWSTKEQTRCSRTHFADPAPGKPKSCFCNSQKPCPQGKFASKPGQLECAKCPPFHTSHAGAASCYTGGAQLWSSAGALVVGGLVCAFIFIQRQRQRQRQHQQSTKQNYNEPLIADADLPVAAAVGAAVGAGQGGSGAADGVVARV